MKRGREEEAGDATRVLLFLHGGRELGEGGGGGRDGLDKVGFGGVGRKQGSRGGRDEQGLGRIAGMARITGMARIDKGSHGEGK